MAIEMIRFGFYPVLVVTLFALAPRLSAGTGPAPEWREVAPGMDLALLAPSGMETAGNARITVLRIDPDLWDLEFAGLGQAKELGGATARDWCKRRGFVAAINAGMFGTDFRTHLGYLGFRGHVNNGGTNAYQSVAAFDPRSASLPRFQIFDLDSPGVTTSSILKDYASAVQNLRLIKRPGSNRWSPQPKQWSEAALGEDARGRILFVFSRAPFSMHDFNRELLASGIGIVAAQHLEGGPKAQLYVHAGDVELEAFGSYETSFRENDENATPWPIPNVLGVRPRSTGDRRD